MNLIQLPIPFPIEIVGGKGWAGPTGPGMAVGWFQPHIEHHIVWIIFLDSTGQCWEVENPFIRARPNFTWGRPTPESAIKTNKELTGSLP